MKAETYSPKGFWKMKKQMMISSLSLPRAKNITLLIGLVMLLAGCAGYLSEESGGRLGRFGGTLLTTGNPDEKFAIVKNNANEYLGLLVGANIIGTMNPGNAAYARAALQYAMEYNPRGLSKEWYNNFNNSMGTITPTQTFLADGVYCRHFIETQRVLDRLISADGTACRISPQHWEIQN
jgi:surface antigen